MAKDHALGLLGKPCDDGWGLELPPRALECKQLGDVLDAVRAQRLRVLPRCTEYTMYLRLLSSTQTSLAPAPAI